jgi:hypothetical protein
VLREHSRRHGLPLEKARADPKDQIAFSGAALLLSPEPFFARREFGVYLRRSGLEEGGHLISAHRAGNNFVELKVGQEGPNHMCCHRVGSSPRARRLSLRKLRQAPELGEGG